MRFLPAIKERPAISPKDSVKYVNVNTIANSIEKAERVLKICRKNGNSEAIATWERILASLRIQWLDATIEVQTNGRFSFE